MKIAKGSRTISMFFAIALVLLFAVPCISYAKNTDTFTIPVRQTVTGNTGAKTTYIAKGNGSSLEFTLTGNEEGFLSLSQEETAKALTVGKEDGLYDFTVSNDRTKDVYTIRVRVKEGAIKEVAVMAPDGMKAEAIHVAFSASTSSDPTTNKNSSTTTTKKVTTRAAVTTAKSAVKARRVNTGDPSNLALWIGIGVAALAALVLIFVVNRKRERSDREEERR